MNTHNFFKLISIAEIEISCSKINENEDDFMKILYAMKILFCYCRIQRTNEKIF
jgi:hypothetical protein